MHPAFAPAIPKYKIVKSVFVALPIKNTTRISEKEKHKP
jgi:hypothetical protein